MIKNINIHAKVPVRTVKPFIYGDYSNVQMDTKDILKLIFGRAIVTEILSDGSTIVLNMNNYNRDNNPKVVVKESKADKKEKDIIEAKTETMTENKEVKIDEAKDAKTDIVEEDKSVETANEKVEEIESDAEEATESKSEVEEKPHTKSTGSNKQYSQRNRSKK